MVNKDLVRLRHMLDSAKAALSFIQGKEREDLDRDRLLLSAVVRELEILGEAAGQVSEVLKNRYPDLPWRQMIAMRNRLIHAYFDVDHDVIWKTLQVSLPTLIKQLTILLSSQ